ncbi:MAG: TetR family transcriptional regulator [Turneriella sp.]|nr:TetR family transcriptional regulator [Turneriella sp.]
MKKAQQRLKTHRALMHAAIRLMSDDRSFWSISLREVTREAGVVPATFYRHFNEMEDLAVDLVDYCFRPMENMVMGVRTRRLTARQLVYQSVSVFIRFARRHRRYFLFLIKERLGGKQRVRNRIRERMAEMAQLLGHDLAGLPEWQGVPPAVCLTAAQMILDQMVLMLDSALDIGAEDTHEEQKLIARARRRVWMILRGALSYKNHLLSQPSAPPPSS